MKTIILHCVLLLVLATSCSSKDTVNEPSLDVNSEKWELVKMTGSFTGVETTGSDMEWQEYYIFNSDETFFKSRDIGGEVKEASGTYTRENLDAQEYLELSYSKGTELVASCTGNNKEELFYKKGGFLELDLLPCNGPVLEYELLQK